MISISRAETPDFKYLRQGEMTFKCSEKEQMNVDNSNVGQFIVLISMASVIR